MRHITRRSAKPFLISTVPANYAQRSIVRVNQAGIAATTTWRCVQVGLRSASRDQRKLMIGFVDLHAEVRISERTMDVCQDTGSDHCSDAAQYSLISGNLSPGCELRFV